LARFFNVLQRFKFFSGPLFYIYNLISSYRPSRLTCSAKVLNIGLGHELFRSVRCQEVKGHSRLSLCLVATSEPVPCAMPWPAYPKAIASQTALGWSRARPGGPTYRIALPCKQTRGRSNYSCCVLATNAEFRDKYKSVL